MFIRTNEPAFTNLTIFDREYLVGLFGDRKYQDGTYVIDYIEEIIQFQKDFMEQVAETRKTYMFTFPVLTFALLWDEKNKDFADMEFSDWCIRHNLKWFDSNFYVGKDITTLSSCCLTEDEEVLVVKDGNVKVSKMKDISEGEVVSLIGRKNDKVVPVLGKKIELPNKRVIKITLENSIELVSTYDHIHLIKRNSNILEKQTLNLSLGDIIATNNEGRIKFDNRYKITSIEEYEYDKNVHCFEIIDSDEKYFTLANGIYTHNCRLTSNLNDVHTHKLEGNVSSIGGSALSIGSIKVSTVNLVRVGLKAKLNKFEFFDKLKEVVEINMIALDRQRHIIKRNIEKGLLPMYTYGLMKMENQYSTIGINGMYNLVKLMGYVNVDEFGFEHISDEGISFMDKILDTLNELKDNHSYDYSFNIESIPAEKASVVFAAKDKLMFPDAKINTNLYANQYIDLRSTTSMSERIKLSGRFDTRVGGGRLLPSYIVMCS